MRKPGVRILGGRWQGRRLEVPTTARPTASRVREALFSIWGSALVGQHFLDLFAGSGAVGIEALSRGAEMATFVESSKSALRALRRNCELVDPGTYRLLALQLPKVGSKLAPRSFAFAFADPPYDFAGYDRLLAAVHPLMVEAGELVVEHSSRATLPTPTAWHHTTTRRYGESCLSFFSATAATEVA